MESRYSNMSGSSAEKEKSLMTQKEYEKANKKRAANIFHRWYADVAGAHPFAIIYPLSPGILRSWFSLDDLCILFRVYAFAVYERLCNDVKSSRMPTISAYGSCILSSFHKSPPFILNICIISSES